VRRRLSAAIPLAALVETNQQYGALILPKKSRIKPTKRRCLSAVNRTINPAHNLRTLALFLFSLTKASRRDKV
jgi:hypothetical protein